jgi:HPt (histidine-containing phosphotransfer) domain-containing protein
MNKVKEMPAPDSGHTDRSAGLFVLHNIHTREALARFAGDEERYRHRLIEFIAHGPAATAAIRQAIADGSQETIIDLVHSLKVRTGMLGMAELYSIALSLENTLKNNEPTDFWLEELERTVDEMSKEISRVLVEHRS